MSGTIFATLSFVDKRQFLTVIQLVLPLHECADHAPTEFVAKSLYSVADSAAVEEATVDPTVVESIVEPLYSTANPTGSGAALTETFCLCVRV
jgi:hypothetical protein